MTEPDKKAWSESMTRLVGFLEQTYLFRLSRERREQLQLLGVKISLSFSMIDFSQSNSVLGLASELNSQPACRILAKRYFLKMTFSLRIFPSLLTWFIASYNDNLARISYSFQPKRLVACRTAVHISVTATVSSEIYAITYVQYLIEAS